MQTTREPHFQPWVGVKYEESPSRLLLVGEGHYLPATELQYDRSTLTQEIVGRIRTGDQVLPFYTRAATTVLDAEQLGSEERATFWEQVAFYNYIPMIAASEARQRPSPEMWAAGIAPFGEVLTRLRPHCVLVLGKSVWNSIRLEEGWSSRGGEQDDEAIRLWNSPGGVSCFATWTAHPSSFGYSRSKWSARIQALFGAQTAANARGADA